MEAELIMAYTQKTKSASYGEDKLLSELKGDISGAFVFLGDEDYMKEEYLKKIREKVLVSEWLDPFNHFIISFSSLSSLSQDEMFARLSDAIEAFPMGGEKKLVEVKDLMLSQASPKAVDTLISILKLASSSEDTVTVLLLRENEFVCDYRTESSPLFKKLVSAAKVVKFDLYTPEKLASWEKKYFSSRGLEITQTGALTLADMCACRMFTVNSEFLKLEAYAEANSKKKIDEDDVKLICSVSEREEAPFALSNAAEKWNIKEVLSAVYAMRDLKKEPVAILARFSGIFVDMLFAKTARDAGKSAADLARAIGTRETRAARLMSTVANVPLSKIESCIDEAYKTDVKLKSSPNDSWVLLEKFIAAVYTPRSLL